MVAVGMGDDYRVEACNPLASECGKQLSIVVPRIHEQRNAFALNEQRVPLTDIEHDDAIGNSARSDDKRNGERTRHDAECSRSNATGGARPVKPQQAARAESDYERDGRIETHGDARKRHSGQKVHKGAQDACGHLCRKEHQNRCLWGKGPKQPHDQPRCANEGKERRANDVRRRGYERHLREQGAGKREGGQICRKRERKRPRQENF